MKRIIVLVTLISFSIIAYADDFSFRGAKWGMALKELNALGITKFDSKEAHKVGNQTYNLTRYINPNEVLNIKMIPINKVKYVLNDGKLVFIQVVNNHGDGLGMPQGYISDIKAELTSQYGKPEQTSKTTYSKTLAEQNTLIFMEGDILFGTFTISFFNLEFYKVLEKASIEGSGGF